MLGTGGDVGPIIAVGAGVPSEVAGNKRTCSFFLKGKSKCSMGKACLYSHDLPVCVFKPCLKFDCPFTHKHVKNVTTKRALISQNKLNLQTTNIVDDSISEPLLKKKKSRPNQGRRIRNAIWQAILVQH